MAGSADGSIVIDTELDTSDVKLGTEEMRRMLTELKTEVSGIGKTFESLGTSVISSLQSIGQTANAIYEKMGLGATQATNANAQYAASVSNAGKSVTGAANAASSYDKALVKTQKQIDAQKAKLSEYYKQLAAIKASTDAALQQTTTDDQAANLLEIEEIEVQNLNNKYAAQLNTLKELEAEYQRLAAAKAQAPQSASASPISDPAAVKSVTKDIEKASQDVDTYQAKINRLRATGGASDRTWKTIRYDIGQTLVKLKEYQSRLNSLKASGQISTEDYSSLSSALSGAIKKAQSLQWTLSPVHGGLKKVGSTALKTAGNLVKLPFKALGAGAKAFGQGLKNCFKNTKSAASQSNTLVRALTSIKRLLITKIKYTLISGIFNSVKEALKSLATFSGSFNTAMSTIQNSASQLSGNVAVSLGNLIQTIEPAITSLINLLSKAVSYLNAFFALLSGKSAVTVAKKQTNDYAKSLSAAGGAAEELKRQVYGFDELNKRSEDSDTGGGGGGSTSGVEFEDVPIDSVLPEKLRSLLEELQTLWNNGEYFNFGERIGEAFNEVITVGDNWINEEFRPKATSWATTIAQTLNGLLTGVNWSNLGKTVADGFNAIVDIVTTFLDELDFNTIVKAIEGFVSGALQNIDFGALLSVFLLPGLLSGVKGFIAGHPILAIVVGAILALGPELGTTLQRMAENIDFASVGTKLSNGLIWALSRMAAAIESADWATLTTTLWNKLVDLVSNIDWPKLLATAAEMLGAAIGAAGRILVTLADILTAAIQEYFAPYIEECGGNVVLGLLKGIWEGIKNIGKWIYENILVPFLEGVKKAFGINSPSTVMKEQGGYIIDGLWEGIKEAWNNITEFFTNLIDGIKKKLSEAWDNIKSTASTAWSNIKTTVTEKFDNLKEKVTSAAETLKTDLSTKWDNIKSKATETWENVKSAVTTKFDTLKSSLSTSADTVKSKLSTTWNNVKSNATTEWDGIKSSISQKFNGIKQTVTSDAGTVKTNLSTAWSGVKSTADSSWSGIKSSVSSTFSTLKTSLTSDADGLKSSLATAWDNVNSTATRTWGNVKTSVTGLWSGLKSTLQQNDWASVGSNLVSGIHNGIKNGWNWLTSTVSNLASNLYKTAKNVLGIHSPSTVFAELGKYVDLGLGQGIRNNEDSVLKTVSNMAQDVSDQFDPDTMTIDMDATGAGLVSRLDGIAAKLSSIANIFREIDSSLANIGGIRIPAIAAGTVVPTRTAVADRNDDPFNSSRFEFFSSDVDERMSDMTYLLRRILERLDNAELGVNIDDLTRALGIMLQNRVIGYGGV